MITNYYFYESNWGVTVAVTHYAHFSVATCLEMTPECTLRGLRSYIMCNDGVTLDDSGEVVDLEITGECPVRITCESDADVPVTLPSASAKEHKLGGLRFGDKVVMTVRVPTLCDFMEGM